MQRVLCAGLCWGETQPDGRQLHFEIPAAVGDQPRSWSPLLVGSSLPSQAQGLLLPSKAGALRDPPGTCCAEVGESVLPSQ